MHGTQSQASSQGTNHARVSACLPVCLCPPHLAREEEEHCGQKPPSQKTSANMPLAGWASLAFRQRVKTDFFHQLCSWNLAKKGEGG